MELHQIKPHIWYTDPVEESDRPVLGYVRGKKFALAVDAGNSRKHVEEFYQALREQDLQLPWITVLTHWHWDHTFGMCAVSGFTIAGDKTNEKLKQVQGWQWSQEAMNRRLETGEDIEMCDTCIRVEYPDRSKICVTTADFVLRGTMTVDLGEIQCQLIQTDAPHCRDNILVYIPQEKTLFVGDADCEDFYHNHGNYDKDKLEAYINLIEKIDFDTYLFGHSGVKTKKEAISHLKEELFGLS